MTLLLRYKFDENYDDSGPNAKNATNVAATLVTAQINKGVQVNGASGYVDTPASITGVLTAFSISFWFRYISSIDTFPRIFSSSLNSDRRQCDFYGVTNANFNDGIRAKIGDMAATTLTSQDFSDGSLYHIVITGNSATGDITIYVDNDAGTISSSTGFTELELVDAGRFGAFSTASGSNEANIDIDDFRLYDHILSKTEITKLFLFDPDIEIEIDSVDYTEIMTDGWLETSADFYASVGQADMFDDINRTAYNIIRNGLTIEIWKEGTIEFIGKVENKIPEENDSFVVSFVDKWIILMEKSFSKSYTAQSTSAIISDIMSTFFAADFSGNVIETTTDSINRIYRGAIGADAIRQLASDIGFVAYVDRFGVFHMENDVASSSGVSINETNEFGYKFEERSEHLVTAVLVEGKGGGPKIAGIKVRVKNSSSIALYGYKEQKIIDNTLTTKAAAISAGNALLSQKSVPISYLHRLIVEWDNQVRAGETSLVTITELNYTATTFLCQKMRLEFVDQVIRLELVRYTGGLIQIVSEMYRDIRKVDKRFSDEASLVSDVEQDGWLIPIKFSVIVNRILNTSGQYNTFQYNSAQYNIASSNSIEVVNQDMEITNAGKDYVRDMIIGAAGNHLDNTNAHIAVGDGTLPLDPTDTVMENEIYREKVGAGYPSTPAVGITGLGMTIEDGDVASDTFTRISLFNNSSGGIMVAQADPAVFSKTLTEDLDIVITGEVL